MNAKYLTVRTYGNSSAAIRSDRGGGDVNVTKGTYKTSGTGSPAIYSTADIDVTGAKLTSTKSEAMVIEGGNSITLNKCNVTGNNTTKNGQAKYLNNVLIYQSMSGDASTGASDFTMNGGTMTSKSGAMFHDITNVDRLLDKLDGGIGMFVVEGNETAGRYFNDGFFELLGTSREERGRLFGNSLMKQIHPEDVSVFSRKINDAIKNNSLLDADVRMTSAM